jgi:hypothetical protein
MWFSISFKTPNFYKIPISSLGAMPQQQNYIEGRALGQPKNFLFFNFFGLDFFT